MSHSFPNMVGVDQGAAAADISRPVPGYMPMGKGGMAEMQAMSGMMRGPRNTTPMMGGRGPGLVSAGKISHGSSRLQKESVLF